MARLIAGPVAINDTWGWWTFLTQPCPQSQRELPPVLRAAKVTPVPRRGWAVLPLPDDPASWYQQLAKGQSLPPWTTVISTVHNVVERRRNTAQVIAI